jgi:hypothetical protein
MTTLILIPGMGMLCFLYYMLWRRRRIKTLARKLNNAKLDDFIRELGEKYRTRPLDHGKVRYKWTRPLCIVRADFERGGRKAENINITRRRILKRDRRSTLQQ